VKLLRSIPSIGPIRAALLVALMQTPHRFRTKRQFWSHNCLALKTYGSGEYRFVDDQLTLMFVPNRWVIKMVMTTY
jgi:transposase